MSSAHMFCQRHVLRYAGRSFLVLGMAYFVFGACTLNLAVMLAGNLRLLGEHGWLAAMEGGLRQFVELVATGYLGIAAYIVLKACERRCVQWLTDEP